MLIDLIKHSGDAFTLRDIQLGCPLGNLAQEMAPIDEGFRLRLNRIYELWHEAVIESVSRAQQAGLIMQQVEPRQLSLMVVATLEGCLSAGMISQDMEQMLACGAGLIQYLTLIQQSQE